VNETKAACLPNKLSSTVLFTFIIEEFSLTLLNRDPAEPREAVKLSLCRFPIHIFGGSAIRFALPAMSRPEDVLWVISMRKHLLLLLFHLSLVLT
jgi:hypothetical protein